MEKTVFKVLGVRATEVSDADSRQFEPEIIDRINRRIERMQKAFSDYLGLWMGFYGKIEMSDDEQEVRLDPRINDDQRLFSTRGPSVSISALVGKNGAGKSALVDLMMRVMNNVAAAVLGEKRRYPGAEHLHFVDNVYADIMLMQGDVVKVISCKHRRLKLVEYERIDKGSFRRKGRAVPLLEKDNGDWDLREPLTSKLDEFRDMLSDLFYTCVFNYSVYSFNHRDYVDEFTHPMRLGKILGKNVNREMDVYSQDRCWLTGLFHKNDGYQTPIVLNPMRDNGLFSGAKETELAKDRLLALMFYKEEKNEHAVYPFRNLNAGLEIVGLSVSKRHGRDWSVEEMQADDTLRHMSDNKQNIYFNITRIYDDIQLYYRRRIGPGVDDDKAFSYLAYKTIKIFFTYDQYSDALTLLDKYPEYRRHSLDMYLDRLLIDRSHIAAKIRRVICSLYTGMYQSESNRLALEELDSQIETWRHDEGLLAILGETRTSDFVPSPHRSIDFVVNKHHPETRELLKANIPFRSLSSGERQMFCTLSNFIYHLANVNSVMDRPGAEKNGLTYRYVNAIFDEVELYYHPDMQRQFVTRLMQALNSVSLGNIKGINILLVTHSPFILSDIPRSNILPLHNGEKLSEGETFCSNIYDMLGQSFFMKNSIGEYARSKVAEFQECFRKRTEASQRNTIREKLPEFQYLVDHIGDPYIKRTLTEQLNMMRGLVDDEEKVRQRIDQLEYEAQQLRQSLAERNHSQEGEAR